MGCIFITKQIEKLTEHFPKEIARAIANYIGVWQEKNGKPEDLPTVDQLRETIKEERGEEAFNVTVDDIIEATKDLIDEDNTLSISTVTYNYQGRTRTYTIKGSRIFNSKNEEVFIRESKDRIKIFANLAIQQGRAVVVEHRGLKYVVNQSGTILSVKTGKIQQWQANNGNRVAIINLANKKFAERNQPQTTSSTLSSLPKITPLQRGIMAVNQLMDFSKRFIKFDSETHTYWVNGEKADVTASSYGKPKKDIDDQWTIPSSRIGNTFDAIGRDFFEGTLKEAYPNVSREQLADIVEDFKQFKKILNERYGVDDNGQPKYKVFTSEDLKLAAKVTEMVDGKPVTKIIAGTMDMVVVDSEGFIHIYDFKTYRTGTKSDEYQLQLTNYANMFEAAIPDAKGRIKDLNIIPAKTMYPGIREASYSFTGTRTMADGVPLVKHPDYKAPRINFTEAEVLKEMKPKERPKLIFSPFFEKRQTSSIQKASNFNASEYGNFSTEEKRRAHSAPETNPIVITSPDNTAAKAKEIGGIDTLRHPNKDGMHFGNPFSHYKYPGVKVVVPTAKEAVIAYEQWLRGIAYRDIEPERRRWILEQINSGALDGKPLVYYTTVVPDNSYGRKNYDYVEAPNHVHILQYLIDESKATLAVQTFDDKEELKRSSSQPQNAQNNTSISNQPRVTVLSAEYKKELPAQRPDVDFVFPDNAQAYTRAQGFNTDQLGKALPIPSKIVLNVNAPHNQADIRTDEQGNVYPNTFGLVVKKFQQNDRGDFVHKEGQFQDTDEDFELLKQYNRHMFDRLQSSQNTNKVFPSSIATGRAALPLRFAEWLKEELKTRYNLDYTIVRNLDSRYDGWGLTYQERKPAQQQQTTSKQEEIKSYITPNSKENPTKIDTGAVVEVEGEPTIILKNNKNGTYLVRNKSKGVHTNSLDSIKIIGRSRTFTKDGVTYIMPASNIIYKDDGTPLTNTSLEFIPVSNEIARIQREEATKFDVFMMNTEVAEVTDEQTNKLYSDYDAVTRQDRVNFIVHQIEEVTQRKIKEEINSCKKALEEARNSNDLQRQGELEVMISALENPETAKEAIFNKISPSVIFKEVKNLFENYLKRDNEEKINEVFEELKESFQEDIELGYINEMPSDSEIRESAKQRVEYRNAEYQKLLDNYEALCRLATPAISLLEGFIVISKALKAKKIQEDEDNNQDRTGADNKEETYKDGWMENYKHTSSESTLAQAIKKIELTVPQLDDEGYEVLDDLGNVRFMPLSTVHATLMKALDNGTKVEDMVPLLVNLSKTHKWVISILEAIISKETAVYLEPFKDDEIIAELIDLVSEDTREETNRKNMLFNKFYSNYNRDYTPLWIQKTNDNGVIETIRVNVYDNSQFMIDDWKGNQENKIHLSPYSVYDSKEAITNINNSKKGKQIVDNIVALLNSKSKSDIVAEIAKNSLILENIVEALRMLGVNTPESLVKMAILYDGGSQLGIIQLSRDLKVIYDSLVKGGSSNLMKDFQSRFESISELFSNFITETIESSTREAGKSYYSHFTPSYMGKHIRRLRDSMGNKEEFDAYMEENYGKNWWFKTADGEWLNEVLKNLSENENDRKHLDYKVVLHVDKAEYSEWDNLITSRTLLIEYLSQGEPDISRDNFGYYQIPILSDNDSGEFIRLRRYVSGSDVLDLNRTAKQIIIEKLVNLVRQEHNRIMLVRKRGQHIKDKDGRVVPIARYDQSIKNGEVTGNGGAEFKFIPALNEYKVGDKLFIDWLSDAIQKDSDWTADSIKGTIMKALDDVLTEDFRRDVKSMADDGLFERKKDKDGNPTNEYVHLPFKAEAAPSIIEEWWFNSVFAESQIIQIFGTDLAFYNGITDFQKRWKEVRAPATKYNTKATWDGVRVVKRTDSKGNPMMASIILSDEERASHTINDIQEIINDKVSSGDFTVQDGLDIIKQFKNINVADAQAFRSLDSYRRVMIMKGDWSDTVEESYKRIKSGHWTRADFNYIWQTIKPYVYTQVFKDTGLSEEEINEGKWHGGIKTGIQYKNSEFLLLANILISQHTALGKSEKLQALSEFLTENDIDTAQFESTTKVGGQGPIDISDATIDKYIEDAKSKGRILSIKDAVKEILENAAYTTVNGNRVENSNVVQLTLYEDWGIQNPTPEHIIDHHQLVPSQMKKLGISDLPDDFKMEFKLPDGSKKVVGKKELQTLYSNIIIENNLQGREELKQIFSDPKNVQKAIQNEIEGNPKYSTDLLEAFKVDENGRWVCPPYDSVISETLQQILHSIIKKHINKQQILGGSTIQVSCFGINYDDSLEIHYDVDPITGKKRPIYADCYMPAYSKAFYEAFMDYDEEGNCFLHIDDWVDKKGVKHKGLSEDLRRLVGLRVPTEDKYSMLPLRIKGWLPQQNGSAIMLPAEITTLSGSDFDKLQC